jgi:hypothetical protein
MGLPPLPVDHYIDDDGLWSERRGPYSEDQMREYGEACYSMGDTKKISSFDEFMAEAEKIDPEGFARSRELEALRKDGMRYRRLTWTVFNGFGAVVADNVDADEARAALTSERCARGWFAVSCVVAKQASDIK